jgi:hypothetical protein
VFCADSGDDVPGEKESASVGGTAKRVTLLSVVLGGGIGVEGYCVKCRAKKEIKEPQEVTMKNGRPATQGVCPDCGTKIFKIGKAK